MKKLLVGFTVLLVHTAAAHAQQVAPAPEPVPAPPAAAPAPPPAAAPAAPAPEYPPAYAPPPGYYPPGSSAAAPPPPPPPPPSAPTYGAPPVYGAPPAYGPPVYPPPPYRYGYRYASPPTYYAYPPSPPPRDVLYRPFTLGGGIGFGGLIFQDQNTLDRQHQGGLSYTFRLGFGLCPGLLLLWDVEGAAVEHGASSLSQTANLVALQLFATRRFFLKGGFGVAAATQDNATLWGAAAMGGVGYELIQGWNWSFDVEATITGAHINTNGADQTWSNWSLVNFALNFF